jgi:5-methylcytosine-specific restriction endonuclease McrA
VTNRLHIQGQYPANRAELHDQVRAEANGKCIRCGHPDDLASGHVLTVHHFDGNKSNSEWWNLMALCQRCHLKVQGRVNPQIVYFLEHSEWAKPYIAGFYAHKYECRAITREEAMARLDQLLAYERIA